MLPPSWAVLALFGLLVTGLPRASNHGARRDDGGSTGDPPLVQAVANQRAQEVRLPLIEPPTLDPGLAEDVASVEVIDQLFDGLVRFDDKGTMSAVGADRWTISSDGLTYTFTLRAGRDLVGRQSGHRQDYAWAWKRNISPTRPPPTPTRSSRSRTRRPSTTASSTPSSLASRPSKDDRTLVVTLEKPAALLSPARQHLDADAAPQDHRREERRQLDRAGQHRHQRRRSCSKSGSTTPRSCWSATSEYWGRSRAAAGDLPAIPGGGSDRCWPPTRREIELHWRSFPVELPPNQVDRVNADPSSALS